MAEPEAHRDPLAMQQFFAEYGVTTTHFVPSMLAAFVASLTPQTARQNCSTLKQVFCSGEALPADLCREWQQLTGAPLHNLYGPTEAAVDVELVSGFWRGTGRGARQQCADWLSGVEYGPAFSMR